MYTPIFRELQQEDKSRPEQNFITKMAKAFKRTGKI